MNLTALLALAVIADLGVQRLAVRSFLPPLWRERGFGHGLTLFGAFASHLAGILAVTLFVAAVTGALRRHELFPRGMRWAAAAFSVGFTLLVLCALGVAPVTGKVQLYLKITFAFLAWILAFAASRPPVIWRAKLGVTLLAFPAIVHAAALFTSKMASAGVSTHPAELARVGLVCAFVAAGASPWLLGAWLWGRMRVTSWVAGAAAAAVIVGGLVVSFDLVNAVAMYGFYFELARPVSAGGMIETGLLVFAAFGGVAFVAQALGTPGPARLAGLGLVILVATGYQNGAPGGMAAAACGLLAVALAVVRVPTVGRPPHDARG